MTQLGQWVDEMALQLVPYEQRPDAAAWSGGPIYRAAMVFTTLNGSWEKGGTAPGCIDGWAVDAFQSGRLIDGAGGDHNLFVIVLDKDGKPIPQKGVLFWQGELKPQPSQMDWVQRSTKNDGTENIPIFGSYAPDRGEHGSWGATTLGRSDALMGVGMPYNAHISTFLVLQATDATDQPETGDLAVTNALLRELIAAVKAGFRL